MANSDIMINLAGATGLLDDAREKVCDILDIALGHAAITAADLRACAEAAILLEDEHYMERTLEVLIQRAKAYGHTDVSAATARDFAIAWRSLRDKLA